MLGGPNVKCRWCGKGLEQRGHKPRLFCNASCRSKAWQRKREKEVSAALMEIEAAAQRIRRVVGREEMSEDSD